MTGAFSVRSQVQSNFEEDPEMLSFLSHVEYELLIEFKDLNNVS